MQVQSKFAKSEILSWKKFFNDKIDLFKYKNKELKEVLKHYKLHVTGKKSILVERLVTYFNKIKNIIKLQSIMRMFIVFSMIKMRGPALKDRKKCINEKDFYSLEPIENIHIYDFFSFKDDKGFIYGFDLNSLVTMFRKQGNLTNPYNRDKIGFDVIKKISYLSKLNKYMNYNNTNCIETTVRDLVLQKLASIRSKETNFRIEELFHEMDLLGNYTNSSWFINLTRQNLVHLLRYMWDIWNFRGNIPNSTKRKISPYFNPFTDGVENLEREHFNNAGEERLNILKKTSLTIMENFVYSGINSEFKQLGCMIVLSALTLVSIPARNSLPWLYESLEPL